MINDFENRLRNALRHELGAIEQRNLRRPVFKRSVVGYKTRQSFSVFVTVAAAAAVVAVLSLSILLVAHKGGEAKPQRSTDPGGYVLEVQGARLFVPEGRRAVDASSVETDSTNPYLYCLVETGTNLAKTGCLNEGGILVRIARVPLVGPVKPVQGAFQSNCGQTSTPTVPIQTQGMIGRYAKADIVTITCGSNVDASTTFWETTDRTFTIQSPYDGARGRVTAEMVAEKSDLSQWLHKN